MNGQDYGADVDKIDTTYCGNYWESYDKQFTDMKPIIEPTQWPGGDPRFILEPVVWKNRQADSAELWLAQEDIWVKRSVLNIIRDANDIVRVFKPEPLPATEKETPGVVHKIFTNPYWRVDLRLEQGKLLTGTIKNITKRRQSLNVKLKVLVRPDLKLPGQIIPLEGNPISPSDPPLAFKPVTITSIVPQGIFGLEQVLDRRTVPIKEIGDLCLTTPGTAS